MERRGQLFQVLMLMPAKVTENIIMVSAPWSLSSAEAPAGYPHQNSNNRKNRKRAGDDGKRERSEGGKLLPLKYPRQNPGLWVKVLTVSLYTDVVLFFFSFFWKTSACARARARASESFPHPYPFVLAVNKSPTVYFLSRTFDGLWRENRGSVNRVTKCKHMTILCRSKPRRYTQADTP